MNRAEIILLLAALGLIVGSLLAVVSKRNDHIAELKTQCLTEPNLEIRAAEVELCRFVQEH